MKIIFNKSQPACIFEHILPNGSKLQIEFSTLTHIEVNAWSRTKDGYHFPDYVWEKSIQNGIEVQKVNTDLFTVEDRMAYMLDDFKLGASKLVRIVGLEIESDEAIEDPEKYINEMSLEDKANILYLLGDQIPEFYIWFKTWLNGSKKKSGKMVID